MKISETYSSLMSAHQDWLKLLVNPYYIRNKHTITWDKYERINLSPTVHKSDVIALEKNKQYSFQIMNDGSILQLYYQYDRSNRILTHANLAYYNSGSARGINEEYYSPEFGEGYVSDDTPDLSIESDDSDDPIVPWLRIDYSPDDQRGPLHHACHMHIGLFEHARIPLSGVPSPKQFIEFIMASCYPEQYKSHRLNQEGEPADIEKLRAINSVCFPATEGCVFEILPHFTIPICR